MLSRRCATGTRVTLLARHFNNRGPGREKCKTKLKRGQNNAEALNDFERSNIGTTT